MTKTDLAYYILKNCEYNGTSEELIESDNLSNIGINSIMFIKIVIDLETEFDFEFADEALEYTKYNSFSELYNYINALVENTEYGESDTVTLE